MDIIDYEAFWYCLAIVLAITVVFAREYYIEKRRYKVPMHPAIRQANRTIRDAKERAKAIGKILNEKTNRRSDS
jgi:hypothetical protein